MLVEIPAGWWVGWGGGYFCGQQMEIPGRRGGEAFVKFPPWWGYGYFLEPPLQQPSNIKLRARSKGNHIRSLRSRRTDVSYTKAIGKQRDIF